MTDLFELLKNINIAEFRRGIGTRAGQRLLAVVREVGLINEAMRLKLFDEPPQTVDVLSPSP